MVVLRPSKRNDIPSTDLKYDMRVLSDRIEYFILLGGRGDGPILPTLNGSVWAWDGKQLNVSLGLLS